MNVVFIEDSTRENLYPFNLARPNATLRVGAFTFKERWNKVFPNATFSYDCPIYLASKFPMKVEESNLFLNPVFLPNSLLVSTITNLKEGEALMYENELIAFKGSFGAYTEKNYNVLSQYEMELLYVKYPWDFFRLNEVFLQYDLEFLKKENEFQQLPDYVHVTGDKSKIYVEVGANVEHSILNTLEGEIYISKNAKILEGSIIRGTTFLGENATVNMGSKIYGKTTIGPYCKAGGELNNVVMMQYSNKGHEGFLGNSVIGEWCNLGADTNNSNLKNTYSEVEVWSRAENKYVDTGLQFCGLMMGDHSKSAINTQFNTGTVAGFSANIFQAGFPPKNIASFSFGGSKSSPKTRLNSAIETATKMMDRRNIKFTQEDKAIFEYLYEND